MTIKDIESDGDCIYQFVLIRLDKWKVVWPVLAAFLSCSRGYCLSKNAYEQHWPTRRASCSTRERLHILKTLTGTNAMDLPCSLDDLDYGSSIVEPAQSQELEEKVEERVSIGQGEAFALLIVNLTCSLDARLRFQKLVSSIFGMNSCNTCCRKKMKNQRPKSRTSCVSM